jgi:hypothetical protein
MSTEGVVRQSRRTGPRSNSANPTGRALFSQRLRGDIMKLHRRGLVPLAIADALYVRPETVARILRENGVDIPSYLTTTGPKRRPESCPHCNRRLP